MLAVYLTVFAISFATSVNGRTVFGPSLGADFAAFYVAGKIYITHQRELIYDTELQHELLQKQFPYAPPDAHLPYVNAPFFILPFAILARLPYSWAYLFWVLLSLALYVAGFSLIWTTLEKIPPDAWLIALLLALSFMPFLVECLAGGQTSAVGFFCLALALNRERRGQHILSGLALSLCIYKPTLLLLLVPMLLITRRYSTLLGFAAGCVLLALVSLIVVGWEGCVGYINTLLYFTNASTSSMSGLRSWKYVDINSFFRLLAGDHSYVRWALTAAAFIVTLPFIFTYWWKAGGKPDGQSLDWALAITWTLVLNLYLGIYDTTLVVLSLLLTTNAFYRSEEKDRSGLPVSYKLILLLVYVVPSFTQPMARLTYLQIYTIVLALLGGWQLIQFQRQSKSPREVTIEFSPAS